MNPRRLARWRRPDLPTASFWGGRWSLARTPGTMGPVRDEQELAEIVARQWLARYGVVSRDWWRRERPAVPWRSIYRELKRLEFRGDVQRGYFVDGLAGAQFALAEAVELLRAGAGADDHDDEPVVIAASDPANVYALPLSDGVERDPLTRPRGAGALIVMRGSRAIMTAEGRGRRIHIRDGLDAGTLSRALQALVKSLGQRRDIVIDTIDGVQPARSVHAAVFAQAGFRSEPGGWRYRSRPA